MLAGFVRRVLEGEGALVETQGAGGETSGGLEVLMPAEVASALGMPEHCLLRVATGGAAGDGALDVGFGTERLQRLAERAIGSGRVTALRVRPAEKAPDPPARYTGLNVSLGKAGEAGGGPAAAVERCTVKCLAGAFRYRADADDQREGLVRAAVTLDGMSAVPFPSLAGLAVEAGASPDLPGVEALETAARALETSARRAVLEEVASFREAVARRHGRDVERLSRYFRDLREDLRSRIRGRPSRDLEAKLAGLPAELARRREALAATYRMRIRLEPVALLYLETPGAKARLRLRRRAIERTIEVHWSGLTRTWLPLQCEGCGSPLHALALCDEARHVLCAACWDACGSGGRRPCFLCEGKPRPQRQPPAGQKAGPGDAGPARRAEPHRAAAESKAAAPLPDPPVPSPTPPPLSAPPVPRPLSSPSRAWRGRRGKPRVSLGRVTPEARPGQGALVRDPRQVWDLVCRLLSNVKGFVLTGELRGMTRTDPAVYRRVMADLVSEGLVERHGVNRGTAYRWIGPTP